MLSILNVNTKKATEWDLTLKQATLLDFLVQLYIYEWDFSINAKIHIDLNTKNVLYWLSSVFQDESELEANLEVLSAKKLISLDKAEENSSIKYGVYKATEKQWTDYVNYEVYKNQFAQEMMSFKNQDYDFELRLNEFLKESLSKIPDLKDQSSMRIGKIFDSVLGLHIKNGMTQKELIKALQEVK